MSTAISPVAVLPAPRVALVRAVVALLWAVTLALVAGDGPELSSGLVVLVAAYPLIDVVASLSDGRRLNAAISGLAVVGLAVAGFGADAGAVLAVFGAWALVSGVLQLAAALRRRRAGSRELPMVLSGGISALAGISFIASSGADDPTVVNLAGYAAFGALLYLVWAYRTASAPENGSLSD